MRQPSPSELRELLDYDGETGVLTWRARGRDWFKSDRQFKTWNSRYAGKPALTAVSDGYRCGAVLGFSLKAHRAIWAIVYDEWPTMKVDHINRERTDNRLYNLRLVSDSESARNRNRRFDNRTGITGVSWCAKSKMWKAQFTLGGVRRWTLHRLFDDAVISRRDALANDPYYPVERRL